MFFILLNNLPIFEIFSSLTGIKISVKLVVGVSVIKAAPDSSIFSEFGDGNHTSFS